MNEAIRMTPQQLADACSRAMWDEDFWKGVFDPSQVAEWDRLIDDFNAATGVLKAM